MEVSNKAYKKLTNANGLVRVFSIISTVICVVAVLLEPLGKLLYNMIFSKKIDYLMVKTFKSYVAATQYSYIFLAMSIALIVAAFSSKNKKNIGQGFSCLMVIVPIVTSVDIVIDMLDYTKSSIFKAYMNGADNLKFRGLMILMVYVLALCAALILIICGAALLVKASGERPTEVIAVVNAKIRPAAQPMGFNPQQNQFGQPGGFQPNNQFGQQGFGGNGGFGAAPFASNNNMNNNTQSPFAPPQNNAVAASAPMMEEVRTENITQNPVVKEAEQTVTETASALPKVCSECGTVLADNAKFCKNCGKPV